MLPRQMQHPLGPFTMRDWAAQYAQKTSMLERTSACFHATTNSTHHASTLGWWTYPEHAPSGESTFHDHICCDVSLLTAIPLAASIFDRNTTKTARRTTIRLRWVAMLTKGATPRAPPAVVLVSSISPDSDTPPLRNASKFCVESEASHRCRHHPRATRRMVTVGQDCRTVSETGSTSGLVHNSDSRRGVPRQGRYRRLRSSAAPTNVTNKCPDAKLGPHCSINFLVFTDATPFGGKGVDTNHDHYTPFHSQIDRFWLFLQSTNLIKHREAFWLLLTMK